VITTVLEGDKLPEARDMFPHTAAARLGCAGCQDAVTFEFTGDGCATAADKVYAAGEIAKVPVKIVTNQRYRSLTGDCTDAGSCGPSIQEVATLLQVNS